MTFTQAQIICEFADNDMNLLQTAKVLYRSRSGLQHILKHIERETGKNPLCFHHLCELLPEARAILEGEADAD